MSGRSRFFPLIRHAAVASYFATLGAGILVATAFAVRHTPIIEPVWEEGNLLFLLGAVLFALAAGLHLALSLSATDALLFIVLTLVLGGGAEFIGVQHGYLFGGRYIYHEALQPIGVEGVPLVITLGWLVFAHLPLVIARYTLKPSADDGLATVAASAFFCAILLTAIDLLIEPLAQASGAWQWNPQGTDTAAPIGNYLGWWLVGFTIYALFFLLRRSAKPRPTRTARLLDGTHLAVSTGLTLLASWSIFHNQGMDISVLAGLVILLPAIWRAGSTFRHGRRAANDDAR